jgi:hypothetical protein
MGCMGCMAGETERGRERKLLPNTVRANTKTPLYLMGWTGRLDETGSLGLGQDDGSDVFDTSGLSPIETVASGMVPPQALPDTISNLPSWYGTGQLETTQAGGGYAPNPGTFGTTPLASSIAQIVGGATNAIVGAAGASRPSPVIYTGAQSSAGSWLAANEGWLLPVGLAGLVLIVALSGKR